MQSTACERALLIGIRMSKESQKVTQAHLEELLALVSSLGIKPVESIAIGIKKIHPRWLLGSGKVEELKEIIATQRIDLLVFDHDLSPAQQRNLEKIWEIAVIDRCEVILDIFADRARTREAVVQVALARMQYSLPRLKRAWTHLSRQRGGARGNRGKGETQLESDRRFVLNKMTHLKKEIKQLSDQREIRRKKRRERPFPSVSLLGYTNAGKSSLLKKLSATDIPVKDELFATLDPTTRRIKNKNGLEFLMTDTVGFIRKLPHDLIDAFHSTLEEALIADLIIQVADAGSSELEEHLTVTDTVLKQLGADEKERFLVLNKADTLSPEQEEALLERYPDALLLSAEQGKNLDILKSRIDQFLNAGNQVVKLCLPASRWDLRAHLYQEASILKESYEADALLLTVRLSGEERGRLAQFVVK